MRLVFILLNHVKVLKTIVELNAMLIFLNPWLYAITCKLFVITWLELVL